MLGGLGVTELIIILVILIILASVFLYLLRAIIRFLKR